MTNSRRMCNICLLTKSHIGEFTYQVAKLDHILTDNAVNLVSLLGYHKSCPSLYAMKS